MKLRQMYNLVLVVAVSAFLALIVFISGCEGSIGK